MKCVQVYVQKEIKMKSSLEETKIKERSKEDVLD